MNILPVSLCLDGRKVVLRPGDFAPNAKGEACARLGDLLVRLSAADAPDYVWQTLHLENTGAENSPQLSHICSLELFLPDAAGSRFYTLHGDDCSARSFLPDERKLTSPVTLEPWGGRSSSATAFPFFDLTLPDGETILFGVGWTGQWKAELIPERGGVRVSIGLSYCDLFLRPGESLRFPSVFVTRGRGGEATRQAFKRLLLRDFDPLAGKENKALPFAIQPFDRYFKKGLSWETEQGQLHSIDAALRCRELDTLWLDAAWFRDGFPTGVGNYAFSEGFPHGLRPIAERAHEKGMRFVVWFEPERVYKGSDLFQNHPEFLLSNGDPNTFLLNLGDETAWNWIFTTLRDFLIDNQIDVYRQDFNMEPLLYWVQNDEPNRVGITEIRYITGLYRLWDELRAAIPGLEIDNCASGGRRLDFELIRRSYPLWRSDTNCFAVRPDWHSYTFNQVQTMALAQYLPYHAAAIWEPDVYQMRSAAALGLACAFDILNPAFPYEKAARVLHDVKRLVPYWSLDFYPMTPIHSRENDFAAYRFERDGVGCAFLFRREECEKDSYLFSLPTLSPETSYRLILTDQSLEKTEAVYSGKELIEGIELTLAQKPDSLIVEYCPA